MKKILYITNIPAPYTVEFFNALGKNYELTVVFEGKNSAERDSSWSRFNAIGFSYIVIDKKNASPLRLPTGILKILKEQLYDLYIVGNYSTPTGMLAITWLRKKRLPYAIHADGGLISNDSLLRFQVKRHFIRGASMYFSSGKMTTEYFVHYGADSSKIHEYPFSSVHLDQIRSMYDVDYYRQSLELGTNDKIVVSVGQIIPRKGFDVLIRAISLVSVKVKLYIIGGEATEDLKKLIHDLKLENVEFIPFVPFKVTLEYMAAADVFALLTREDIWGLVINEAMSMGTPIVSTNKCVAAVEMIEDGVNGYIVESEDFGAAAERISYLLEHETLSREMRKNNVQKSKMYTIETMTDSYTDTINNFFKNHECGAL